MKNKFKKLINLKAVIVSPLLNAPFGNYSNVHYLLDVSFVSRQKIGSVRVIILTLLIFYDKIFFFLILYLRATF